MNVEWTAPARRHLRAIHDYIARDSPFYARRMVARIVARSEQLSRFPEAGRVVREYTRSDVREVFEDPYRIMYRIKGDAIHVIAVVHGAPQLDSLLITPGTGNRHPAPIESAATACDVQRSRVFGRWQKQRKNPVPRSLIRLVRRNGPTCCGR